MEGEVLKKFGRYFLLHRIAQGGMAEIYLARLAAVDGDGRFLVIKRIQSSYWDNVEFLQMFKSEIKVTMGLSHPNIVQLYDFGEENGRPYIAMEHVDGKNLRQFISRFNELKETFPVDIAAYIVEQVASGLQYAHTYKDKMTGMSLNIVHRDISPQNVLISAEGAVKIIDFGIAKASTNSEATKFGIIKGKPSYLSPEQISGDRLDGRSDVFSLGIVLWELLVGRKLFAGTNELAVLRLIESCTSHVKPPSFHNKKVPPEMDELTLKALSKNPDKRFQNAEEFQRAMHRFLYSQFSDFNPSDLSYFVKELFKNEIVEDRKRVRKLNDQAQKLIEGSATSRTLNISPELELANAEKEDTTTVAASPLSTGAREVFSDSVSAESNIEIETSAGITAPRTKKPIEKTSLPRQVGVELEEMPILPQQKPNPSNQKSSRPRVTQQKKNLGRSNFRGFQFFLFSILSVAAVYFTIWKEPPWNPWGQETLILQSAEPGGEKDVAVKVDGKLVGTSLPLTLSPLPVGELFEVTVESPEKGNYQRRFRLRKGEKRKVLVEYMKGNAGFDPEKLSDNETVLILRISPCAGLANIKINEKPIKVGEVRAIVQLDRPIELVIEQPGYNHFFSEFTIYSQSQNRNPGQEVREFIKDIELEPTKFGRLEIRSSPSAEVFIFLEGYENIKFCEFRTPVVIDRFPTGTYTVHLVNTVLGADKKMPNLVVEESKILKIDEILELKN